MKKKFEHFLYPVVLCLTLGLAPFSPEPHIIGKTVWILGGGKEMKLIDWFDFFLHFSPWAYLIFVFYYSIYKFKDIEIFKNNKYLNLIIFFGVIIALVCTYVGMVK
jgi:hypothetical protein